ncbi:hypothetical protein VTK73DRAFT_8080 [Phialemonium thermophilum]|uniref:Dynactin subunit 4 n=1 Tax=Phialemonium thermophilum TaxID=223376 RepID=A0ABR3WAM5_9PEZI
MAPVTPYTFIQCPCSDASAQQDPGGGASDTETDPYDDDRTFDPRAPRSNYSLFPLEYLLYCEDCNQIRCPRCVSEEIVTYFCPSCLFEVPASNLKSEGNRCTRSCFQCPVCIGPLAVTNLETAPDPNLLAVDTAAPPSGPYVLTCSYCHWTSTEIGVKFDKPNAIYSQLQKLRNGGQSRLTAKERRERRKDASGTTSSAIPEVDPSTSTSHAPPPSQHEPIDVETQFENLKAFYQAQLAESSSAPSGLSALDSLGLASPSSLARIVSLYSGTGGGGLQAKRARSRVGPMREAFDVNEGLHVADLNEDNAIEALRRGGWEGTNSAEQRIAQGGNPPGEPPLHGRARLASELRPIPVLLRTKRSKRCPVCRHIISKPDAKVQTTRFRIRLVAGSYIPSISIRPLNPPTPSPTGGGSTTADLQPLRPVQYLLTFTNPIFEPVKVTLATPATTPGRFASKVTVLCPQFEIDANTDVWDEALKDGSRDPQGQQRRQQEQLLQEQQRGRARAGTTGQHQAEAGKIWERGRNWVSVVIEVVPASLKHGSVSSTTSAPLQLREDEDLLEVPMFVRVEWEADAGGDEVGTAPGTTRDKEAREKRELAYWSVLGIGRISQE